jgi:hypothetical protein
MSVQNYEELQKAYALRLEQFKAKVSQYAPPSHWPELHQRLSDRALGAAELHVDVRGYRRFVWPNAFYESWMGHLPGYTQWLSALGEADRKAELQEVQWRDDLFLGIAELELHKIVQRENIPDRSNDPTIPPALRVANCVGESLGTLVEYANRLTVWRHDRRSSSRSEAVASQNAGLERLGEAIVGGEPLRPQDVKSLTIEDISRIAQEGDAYLYKIIAERQKRQGGPGMSCAC